MKSVVVQNPESKSYGGQSVIRASSGLTSGSINSPSAPFKTVPITSPFSSSSKVPQLTNQPIPVSPFSTANKSPFSTQSNPVSPFSTQSNPVSPFSTQNKQFSTQVSPSQQSVPVSPFSTQNKQFSTQVLSTTQQVPVSPFSTQTSPLSPFSTQNNPVSPRQPISRQKGESQLAYTLRWAQHYKVPHRLLIPRSVSGDSLEYIPLSKFLSSLKRVGNDDPSQELEDQITSLYNTISLVSEDLELRDIVFTLVGMNKLTVEEVSDLLYNPAIGARYTDMRGVMSDYDNWKLSADKKVDREFKDLQRLTKNQAELSKLKPLRRSVFKQEKIRKVYRPKFISTQAFPRKDQILDIFDSSIVTPNIPYIQANYQGRPFIKAYAPESGISLSLTEILPKEDDISKENTIFMLLWLGDSDEDTHYTKGHTVVVEYSLEDNRLTYKLPVKNFTEKSTDEFEYESDSMKVAEESLAESLPKLDLSVNRQSSFTGVFNLYGDDENGIAINREILFHLVNMDPIIRDYMETHERSNNNFFLTSTRTFFPTKYTSVPSGILGDETIFDSTFATLVWTSTVTGDQEVHYTIRDPDRTDLVDRVVTTTGLYYTQISIKTVNWEIAKTIVSVLQRLMRIYVDRAYDIYQLYRQPFMLELGFDSLIPYKETNRLARERIPSKRITKLRSMAPELFGPYYARRTAQREYQPDIIDEMPNLKHEQMVEIPVRYKLPDGSIQYKNEMRMVMQFPSDRDLRPGEKPHFFVCDSAEKKYIGLKVNTTSNSNRYPVLPSCYGTDQKGNPDSNYNNYFLGRPISRPNPTKPNESAHKGYKPEMVSGHGKLWTVLVDVFKFAMPDIDTSKVFRFGVIRDDNSFLHCLCDVTNLSDYQQMDDLQKTIFVKGLRVGFSNNVRPEVAKQELWNFTLNEIKSKIVDDQYFDPRLYYRVAEEYFNVNIVLLTIVEKAGKKEVELVIPPSRLYWLKPVPEERKTVVVLVHPGSETDSFDYPQCEVYVRYENRMRLGLFDSSLAKVVDNIYLDYYRMFSLIKQNNKLYLFRNLSSIVNPRNMAKNIVGQHIDTLGKMRAVVIEVIDNGLSYFITLVTPPAPPLNVPHVDEDKLPIVPYRVLKTSLKLTPSAKSVIGQKTVGLWYDLGEYRDAFYVPVDGQVDASITRVSIPGLVLNSQAKDIPSIQKGVIETSRNAAILLELLKSIYILIVNNKYPDNRVNAWREDIEPIVTIHPTKYDFSRLKYAMPPSKDHISLMSYLLESTGGFIERSVGGFRIVIESQSLLRKLSIWFERYHHSNEGLPLTPITHVSEIFANANDFTKSKDSLVFTSRDTFIKYVSGSESMSIRRKLANSDWQVNQPFIYMIGSGKDRFAIIQNMETTTPDELLVVGIIWNKKKVNIGNESYDDDLLRSRFPGVFSEVGPLMDRTRVNYIVYQINSMGSLTIKSEQKVDDSDPVLILQYKEIYKEKDLDKERIRFGLVLRIDT